MMPRNALVALSLILAFVIAQPAMAAPGPVQASATLGVTFSYSPNVVTVNTQTTGMYSITGGTPPFTITVNGAPSGCMPQTNPFTTSNASDSFQCRPSVTGSFNVNVNVVDNIGNTGQASATLTVNPSTGGGGTGGGTGGNGTGGGGFNLSGLQDLLPIVMIVGIIFLASTVAIAASAVAMAILIPRRLKQIRKAIEGQPMKKPKEKSAAPPPEPAPSVAQPQEPATEEL